MCVCVFVFVRFKHTRIALHVAEPFRHVKRKGRLNFSAIYSVGLIYRSQRDIQHTRSAYTQRKRLGFVDE